MQGALQHSGGGEVAATAAIASAVLVVEVHSLPLRTLGVSGCMATIVGPGDFLTQDEAPFLTHNELWSHDFQESRLEQMLS